MNDEEIKQLLRELSESADAQGKVKSRTVRISLDPKKRNEPTPQPEQAPPKEQEADVPAEREAEKAHIQEKQGIGKTPAEPQEEVQSENQSEDQTPAKARKTSFIGRSISNMQERIRKNNERREEIIRQGDLDPEDEDADPDSVTMLVAAGQKTKNALQNFWSAQKEKAAQRAALREQAELEQALKEQQEAEAKAAEDTVKEAVSSQSEAGALDEKPENSEKASLEAGSAVKSAETGEKPSSEESPAAEAEEAEEKPSSEENPAAEAEEAEEKPSSEENPAAEAEEAEEKPSSEASPAADAEEAEEKPSSEESPAAEAEEAEEKPSSKESPAADAEEAKEKPSSEGNTTAENGEASEKVETGQEEQEQTEASEGPEIPIVRERRKAPTLPAEFESDAHLFRSEHVGETSEEQETENGSLRDRYQAWLTMMEGKGIGRRERIMIAVGAALILLLIIIVMSILSNRRKTAHVTADEGLSVTVEKEPSSWTKEAEVTLGIRTGEQIQSITVNGVNCEFSGTTRTTVRVEADEEQLDVMVVTQQSVLNASVDIPHIDTTAPEVTISSSGGLITIDAADSRSGIEGLYYGQLIGLSDIPEYKEYTEPFAPEGNGVYVYYAIDKAGNMTGPVATNMTPAESIEPANSALTLYPGDTYSLSVQTQPEGAFLNNLSYTSENPDVASVDGSGVVTARADGETDLIIAADGLEQAVCHVTVRSSAQVTISAIGDVTLGDDINFSPLNSFSTVATMNGYSYFFANVKDILSQDDLTFANFEGTLTDQGTRADKTYAFRGDPSYTEILTEGSVEAVTLANNHSSDYGEISLTDTQQYLDEAGIAWVSGAKTEVVEAGGVQVGLVGIYCIDAESTSEVTRQLRESIDTVRKEGADVIITAFHWGQEKEEAPSEAQQTLAHTAIDSGADLVIGHHPHVLQGIEVYADKYIVYSLGNFCFGGNSNPSDLDTMIFQATFHLSRSGAVDGTDIEIIPCSISSDATWNNYQPTPAEGDEAQRILNKINTRSQVFGEAAYIAE